jgi:nicotinamidase-related amidase
VLITIDTQQDTLDGQPFEIEGTTAAAAALGDLCQAYRAAGLPIVHVVRLYLADGSNAEPFRRDVVRASPVLRPGTPGRLLAPTLTTAELDDDALLAGQAQAIGADEWILYKPRWGAFYGTSLEAMLRDRELATIVLGGCNFPNCPRATIFEASERDFEVLVLDDATSGFDERARTELAGIGVTAVTAGEVRSALRET